jgi:hypothetical protein
MKENNYKQNNNRQENNSSNKNNKTFSIFYKAQTKPNLQSKGTDIHANQSPSL